MDLITPIVSGSPNIGSQVLFSLYFVQVLKLDVIVKNWQTSKAAETK